MSIPRVDWVAEPPVDTTGLSRGLSQYPAKVAPLPPKLDVQPRVLGGVPPEPTGPTISDVLRYQGEFDHRLRQMEVELSDTAVLVKDSRVLRVVSATALAVLATSVLVLMALAVWTVSTSSTSDPYEVRGTGSIPSGFAEDA